MLIFEASKACANNCFIGAGAKCQFVGRAQVLCCYVLLGSFVVCIEAAWLVDNVVTVAYLVGSMETGAVAN